LKHRMGRVKPEDWDALARKMEEPPRLAGTDESMSGVRDRERDGFAEDFDFMAGRLEASAMICCSISCHRVPTERWTPGVEQVCSPCISQGASVSSWTRHFAFHDRRGKKHQLEQEHHNIAFVFADLEALHSRNIRLTLWLLLPPFSEPFECHSSWPSSVVRPGGRLALSVDVSSFPRLRDWWLARVLMTIPGLSGT